MRGYASIDMACTKKLSAWAPMMEVVDYQWAQYDSDRLPADYAGPPTVTRETNWLNQYDHGFIPYPYDQIAKLNKSTDRDWWVQDGNLVTLTEWAHQVHCLGLLRQWIYRDQFDYSMFTNTSSTRFHIHKDHCFMILKTMIECQADVTPVLFAKDSSGTGAWKTRDAPRKCRRNDALAIFARRTDIKYAGVDIDDDEDKITLKEATRGLRHPDGRFKSITTSYRSLSQQLVVDRSTLLLCLNILLFIVSSFLFWSSIQDNRGSLRDQTAMPSPVLKGEDLSFSIRKMDARLFPDDNPSIFRQEPSPGVDRAWTIISDTRPIALSREDVLSIGKDPAMAVKLSAEFGLGDDMYAGRIDVLHQLHCLNALRMEIYFDYYYGKKYPGGFNQTDEKHRHHVSHCIYMLLQNILCHANTDVYTHFWTDAVDHPWPDFNIPHKCTNFRAILEWQREHAVNEHMFVDMRRPAGQEAHVMSSKFKKIYNPERFGHLGDNRYDGENA
ncbi:hypothetical protein BDV33DRAFT_227529 [Aspergillus novoparasiticus]|uniref:Tat pathway signal sequence n=1 Tax=Aspergillus novoparasiticus TaxID=986946 RepID=A0A5N6EDW0_9EURO|nr:hypothetical protein BDV33DRAFT_227529 [Aspergillus novoparasiticus]